jgi:hypothetical protein
MSPQLSVGGSQLSDVRAAENFETVADGARMVGASGEKVSSFDGKERSSKKSVM